MCMNFTRRATMNVERNCKSDISQNLRLPGKERKTVSRCKDLLRKQNARTELYICTITNRNDCYWITKTLNLFKNNKIVYWGVRCRRNRPASQNHGKSKTRARRYRLGSVWDDIFIAYRWYISCSYGKMRIPNFKKRYSHADKIVSMSLKKDQR